MATERSEDLPLGVPQPFKRGHGAPEDPAEQPDSPASEVGSEEPVHSGALRPPASPAVRRERTPRPKKPPRAAPANVPIPTRGLPALRYRFNKLLGRPNRVPKLNKQEQRELLRLQAAANLVSLADKVPAMTVCFVNAKGAAATTTTAVHAASVVGDLTRSMLVVSDFNPASGTSAARLGKNFDQTVTIGKLLKLLPNLEDFREFIGLVRPTRYSVRVISADPIVEHNQHLSGKNAIKLLEAIRANCEYHFIDTANDITNAVTLEVVAASDMIVFTANVGVHDSLRQLATSMETLRKHGFKEKVNNSVVVISNLPKGKQLTDYRYFLNVVNISDKLTRELPFDGQFLGVPHDPLIALDREVDLTKLKWDTYQAYLELGIAIFEQAPRFRRNPSEAAI